MEVESICKSCGSSYFHDIDDPNEWVHKFCSERCRNNGAGMVDTTCHTCGKNFLARIRAINIGQGKYCSKECQYKGLSKYRKGKFTGKDSPVYKEKVKMVCKCCGKDYEVYPSRLKKGPTNYCSKECQYADRHGKYTGRNSPRWDENAHITKKCVCCGKEFETDVTLHNLGYGKYCSKECRIKLNSGEHAVNWRGGIQYAPYCHKFTREFRTRVRAFF